MPLSGFHPAVTRWFGERFSAPTEPQRHAWPVIQAGRDALIAAPTGSGKTFAAFLAAIDSLVRQGLDGPLPDATQVLYVSPLKALSNDVQKNLAEPLAEIRRTLEQLCLPDVEIRTLVRTGARHAPDRAHRDRGRDPRGGARQAGKPSRPLPRAARASRRPSAAAHRSLGDPEADRRDRPVSRGRAPRPARHRRCGSRAFARPGDRDPLLSARG